MSSIGKRTSADQPLTEHDIAERLCHSAMRTLKILMDVRQHEGDLFTDVKQSRYMNGTLELLAEELQRWGC